MMTIHCNDVELLTVRITTNTCDMSTWNNYWSRASKQFRFTSNDNGSKFFRSYQSQEGKVKHVLTSARPRTSTYRAFAAWYLLSKFFIDHNCLLENLMHTVMFGYNMNWSEYNTDLTTTQFQGKLFFPCYLFSFINLLTNFDHIDSLIHWCGLHIELI